MKISICIVGFNELTHLKEIMTDYLNYFNDVNYLDLGSEDGSYEFAKSLTNCKVYKIKREPTVEIIHKKYSHLCKYDWVVYADPDERWPKVLLFEISRIAQFSNIGTISAPINFYFKNYKLKGTRWGGNKVRGVAFHKNRIELSDNVHRSKIVKNGFINVHLENQKFAIMHYWMSGYRELVNKHIRYLHWEGKSRYEAGLRVSLDRLFSVPFKSFYHCYFIKKGYKDFFVGLFLSFFWAWYETSSMLRLLRYQQFLKKNSISLD